jgi:hypothetical protein
MPHGMAVSLRVEGSQESVVDAHASGDSCQARASELCFANS